MQHTGTVTLTTGRLILRRLDALDAQSVWRNWAGDAQVQHGYREPVYVTIEAAQALLARYAAAYEKPDVYRWGMFLKEQPHACIGQIAFFTVDTANELCEIEYCIGRAFQNRGYTTEAVRAVTVFGFETVGFNRIQISCYDQNIASRRVIEKCGYTYEGSLRQYFNHFGVFHDRLYFAMLADEYGR